MSDLYFLSFLNKSVATSLVNSLLRRLGKVHLAGVTNFVLRLSPAIDAAYTSSEVFEILPYSRLLDTRHAPQ